MISYYELLGLIKDGKQPDKVKYNNAIYKFDGEDYHNEQKFDLLKDRLFMYSDINLIYEKSIEIIENKPNQILELDYKYKNTYGRVSDHKYSELEIIDKVNELTKAVNYLLAEDKHE